MPTVTDECGEKSEPELEPLTNLSKSDPPKYEDEWGNEATEQPKEEFSVTGNDNASVEATGFEDNGKIEAMKRCLVDVVYGTSLGFRASPEERAETMELVTQLEGINTTDVVELIDGNWI